MNIARRLIALAIFGTAAALFFIVWQLAKLADLVEGYEREPYR